MYEEDIHIWKVLLKQCETVLTHLILVTVMWTTFEVGRSMRSRCIDLKRKGYRRTYQNTDRHTFFFERGHNKQMQFIQVP